MPTCFARRYWCVWSVSELAERKLSVGFWRRSVQLASAVLYNLNFAGFATGKIFKGDGKGVCVPGLNCYSCPGAVGACPLGSLQSSLLGIRYRLPLYILGTLLAFGLLLGRVICGFLCPFGLIQELLFKIPVPKLPKSRVTRAFSWTKYVVLLVFAVALPVIFNYPAFCKFICPAGTLEGGIPLLLADDFLRSQAGALFGWKTALLAAIIIASMFISRFFCRMLCPLGAIYSLFSPVSLLGVKVENDKCDSCGACVKICPMDIKKVGDRECVHCGKCTAVCPHGAIVWKKPYIIKQKSKSI